MRIFVGYPRESAQEVQRIVEFLRGLGQDVWYDDHVVPGDDWRAEREQQQRAADFIVHLVSNEMMRRAGDVHAEFNLTLELANNQPWNWNYYVVIKLNDVALSPKVNVRDFIRWEEDWQLLLSRAVEKRLTQLGQAVPPPVTQVVNDPQRADKRVVVLRDFNAARELSVEFFQYDQQGEYFGYVNALIKSEALKHFIEFRGFVDDDAIPARLEAFGEEPDRPLMFLSLRVEEVFRSGEIVSARILYGEYSGGAHGNSGVYSLNFLTSRLPLCTIHDVLGYDVPSLNRLLDILDGELDRQERAFAETEALDGNAEMPFERTFMLRDFVHDEAGLWALVADFNFDLDGMTFSISGRAGIPHALGMRELKLPWATMRPFLAELFVSILKRHNVLQA